ncbi:hypothetical protein [[Bacillus] enclensis]|uniref:hypothetical protein n=1 Tax=[Bacillus] enclensis TaxID=1402860 RepID=UPI0018DC4FF4|nr:hypothetical protein [[Bacillus] enclensis]MBH9966821.1 hypothetical protein [[Bacillus] enclensis]
MGLCESGEDFLTMQVISMQDFTLGRALGEPPLPALQSTAGINELYAKTAHYFI